MPINYDLGLGIHYVPFDFERYIESMEKDSPLFANFKYFDRLTKSWLTLLKQEDQLLRDKRYLEGLKNAFENHQKEFFLANKKVRYEVFSHELNFDCGETFAVHYDIEKLHVLFQNMNIEPDIIDIANNELNFELTKYIKNKVLDDRPIYVSFTPLIRTPYTVIDGNHRSTAKVKKGITTSKGFIVENTTNTFVFEIEKIFYKFLYEMHLLHIQLSMGEKNHKRLWKDSYIYWLNKGRGFDDSQHSNFASYIKYSFEKIALLHSGETVQSESFIKKLISRFK